MKGYEVAQNLNNGHDQNVGKGRSEPDFEADISQ